MRSIWKVMVVVMLVCEGHFTGGPRSVAAASVEPVLSSGDAPAAAASRTGDQDRVREGLERMIRGAQALLGTGAKQDVPSPSMAMEGASYDDYVCAMATTMTVVFAFIFVICGYLMYKMGSGIFVGLTNYFRASQLPVLLSSHAFDDALYSLKHYPDTAQKYPDPAKGMRQDLEWEKALDSIGDDTKDLKAFKIKQHLQKIKIKTMEMEQKVEQWRKSSCGSESPCPVLSPEDALEQKRNDMTEIAALSGETKEGRLPSSKRGELNTIIKSMRLYLDVDDAEMRKIELDANAGHVDRVQSAMSQSPTIFDSLDEQHTAWGAFERIIQQRLSHMKNVPQAIAQMNLREMDRGFAMGAKWNDHIPNLNRMKELERLRAWTARSRISVDEAEEADKQMRTKSHKPAAVMERLRSYSLTFLNPLEKKVPLLYMPFKNGTYPWAVEFLSWQITPVHGSRPEEMIGPPHLIDTNDDANASNATFRPHVNALEERTLRAGHMMEALSSESRVLLADDELKNAERFVRMDAESKRRTEADCRFHLALNDWLQGRFGFTPERFPWSEMTPGQNLKLSYLNLQARLDGISMVLGNWINTIIFFRTLFSIAGQYTISKKAMERCAVPCEKRNPDLLHKVFTLYVPGPACPPGGTASLRGALIAEFFDSPGSFFFSGSIDSLFDSVFGISPDTFSIKRMSEVAKDQEATTVVYTCLHTRNGKKVVPETVQREVGFSDEDVDFISRIQGSIPTNCPVEPDHGGVTSLGQFEGQPDEQGSSFLEYSQADSSAAIGPHKAAFFAMVSHSIMCYVLSVAMLRISKAKESYPFMAYGDASWSMHMTEEPSSRLGNKVAMGLQTWAVLTFIFGFIILFTDFPILKMPGGLLDLEDRTLKPSDTLYDYHKLRRFLETNGNITIGMSKKGMPNIRSSADKRASEDSRNRHSQAHAR